MKIRIILKSFNKKLINLTSQKIYLFLLKHNITISGFISLPIKIKRFCILRSPHIDKNSREHFELKTYKRFLDINLQSYIIFNYLLKIKLPTGIYFNIKILNLN